MPTKKKDETKYSMFIAFLETVFGESDGSVKFDYLPAHLSGAMQDLSFSIWCKCLQMFVNVFGLSKSLLRLAVSLSLRSFRKHIFAAWSRRFVYHVCNKQITQNGVDDAFFQIFCTIRTLDLRWNFALLEMPHVLQIVNDLRRFFNEKDCMCQFSACVISDWTH